MKCASIINSNIFVWSLNTNRSVRKLNPPHILFPPSHPDDSPISLPTCCTIRSWEGTLLSRRFFRVWACLSVKVWLRLFSPSGFSVMVSVAVLCSELVLVPPDRLRLVLRHGHAFSSVSPSVNKGFFTACK